MSAKVIDCHLSNIIACDISKSKYSEHPKTATVRPIFKKEDRTKIEHYVLLFTLEFTKDFFMKISQIT